MNDRRLRHTATVLPSGLVLVAGGIDKLAWTGDGGIVGLNSAELYDPARETWTKTGSMTAPRIDHHGFAFLISSGVHAGEVMRVGGCSGYFDRDGWIYCQPLRTTEFYVPATGSWEPGPQLLHATGDVIQLADGKLLAVASLDVGNEPPGPEVQILDPSVPDAGWQLATSMGSPRYGARMVLLANGEVLVVGGLGNFGSNPVSSDVERYDPVNDRWRKAASLPVPRIYTVLIRLPSGRVLLAGGCGTAWYDCSDSRVPPTPEAWIYEPDQDVWRPTSPMNYPRLFHSGVLLDSGKVLLAGGNFRAAGDGGTDYYPSPTPEIFDTASEIWSVTGPMPHYVMGEGVMVKLPSGAALFTGGSVNGAPGKDEYLAIKAAALFQ